MSIQIRSLFFSGKKMLASKPTKPIIPTTVPAEKNHPDGDQRVTVAANPQAKSATCGTKFERNAKPTDIVRPASKYPGLCVQ